MADGHCCNIPGNLAKCLEDSLNLTKIDDLKQNQVQFTMSVIIHSNNIVNTIIISNSNRSFANNEL